MPPYSEGHLIEQPAIQLMEHELGWNSVNAYDEPPSSRDAGLRRSSWLMNFSHAVVEELTRDSSVLSLVEGNREIDKLRRPTAWVLFAPEPERKCNRRIMRRILSEWKTAA